MTAALNQTTIRINHCPGVGQISNGIYTLWLRQYCETPLAH